MTARTILHLDLDAFYASVEQLDEPSLRGRPVIVGGHRNRGVVSAASYEARSYGVHSAMPMATAIRICPQACVRPVRMQRYKELSRQIFALYGEYTDRIEPLSIDEAFLDVTASRRLFGTGWQMAEELRRRVRERTGLTVSVGIAPNKFLAKMASERGKPDGIFEVEPEGIDAFLEPLRVEELWGIGKAGAEKLRSQGIVSVADIKKAHTRGIRDLLGDKAGEKIARLARGIDDREVEGAQGEKSIGAEKTYSKDLHSSQELHTALLALSEEVGRRVRLADLRGLSLTLKVRYEDFSTVTRSVTEREGFTATMAIYDSARDLLRKTEAAKRPVRLLGVTLSQLEPVDKGQGALFEDGSRQRLDRLDGTIDELRRRFGAEGVVRGTLLKRGSDE